MENYINFAFHFIKGLKVRQICHILTKIFNNRYYRFVMSKCSKFSSLLKRVKPTILTKSLELFVDMEPSVLNQTSQLFRCILRFDEFFSPIFSENLCTSVCFEVSSALPSYPFKQQMAVCIWYSSDYQRLAISLNLGCLAVPTQSGQCDVDFYLLKFRLFWLTSAVCRLAFFLFVRVNIIDFQYLFSSEYLEQLSLLTK